ncbi:hypothetical protein CLAIMM_08126 [Cladophialophora immunda]|nr:hypothetical protein CLAIMM_08126 [Cladophialophora immunda]
MAIHTQAPGTSVSSTGVPSKARYRLPPGSWDSHVHVVDEDKYPFDPNYPYRPKKASLDELLAFEKELGIDHVCLICMSVYGTDNSSMMAALRQLEGRARAIVCVDPATITEKELQEMHQLGVRGVRVNLKTRDEQMSKETLAAKLLQYADKIRHLGWVIQVYLALNQIPLVADVIPELNIPLVIDHLGPPIQTRDLLINQDMQNWSACSNAGLCGSKSVGYIAFLTRLSLMSTQGR